MSCQNEKNKLNSFIDNFSIIHEEKVEEGENLTLMNTKILFEKAEKSIMKLLKIEDMQQDFFAKLNILIILLK